MTTTIYKLRYTFIFSLLLFVLNSNVYAGGFPLRPGRLLLSPSVTYFTANKQWDGNGVLSPFPNHGSFSSVYTSLYAEYGLSRRLSVVASVPYVVNNYKQDNYHPGTISGLTDLETGLKYYLANINYQYFFSVQGTVITPLYKNTNLGYGETGAELRVAFAGSGEVFGKYCFFNVENGLRQYFGSIGPLQDRYTATVGMALDNARQRNQLSLTFGGFYTTSQYKTLTPYQIANFYTSTNFSFQQLSLSYGHTFSSSFTMIVSAGKFIDGRNTADGSSGSLAIVYHIDTR